jgi:hypothetical protein
VTSRNLCVAARSLASVALWLSVAGGAHADPQATPAAPPAVAPQSAPVSGAAASGNAPDQPGKALAQVTIEAQRANLEHRLNTFVSSITRSVPRDESLRRWRDPICPLVAGLTRDEGEFVLQRVSQIARAAGAPLDKEHCVRPNLVIVVTSKPQALVKSWGDRRNAFGGVRGSLAKFNRFAGKPRPVRVWYNHDFGSAGDTSAVTKGSLQLGPALGDVPSSGCCLGSHFDVKDVLVFTSVAVIVDGKQVVGLQLTQLADFIAMVALTEIDLDASLGAAPTILRLFDARRNGAQLPAGLSAWDQEFLKWLYDFAAPLGSITQRSVITGEMLHDLAP